LTQDDHHTLVRARLRNAPLAGRIEAPLQDVALDHQRKRHLAVFGALRRRADVDQQGALFDQRQGVLGGMALDARPRPGYQLCDAASHCSTSSECTRRSEPSPSVR